MLQMLGKKNGTGAPCFVRYAADGTWEGLDLELPYQNDTPSFSTLASDGACLYLFGGFDKNGDSAAVYRADLETRVFEKAESCPQAAFGLTWRTATARSRCRAAFPGSSKEAASLVPNC